MQVFGKEVRRLITGNFNFSVDTWYDVATEAKSLNMNPPYQRGLVWDLSHKQKLIDSIISGIGVPAVLLRELPLTEEYHYEMVDGKQRISTIVEFMEDKFPYNGLKYSEADDLSRKVFRSACIGASVVHCTNEEAVELYNRVNFGGVPHE
jgi:uncharacterized protein with ParB-like and HNH nuclease domain